MNQSPRRVNVYWCTITINFFRNSFVPFADTKSASFKKEVMIFCQQDPRRGQYPGFLQASKGSVCSSFVLVWSNNHAALSQLMLRNRFHQHHLRCRKTIILCHQIESVSCFISHFYWCWIFFCNSMCCSFLFFIIQTVSSPDTIKEMCSAFDAQLVRYQIKLYVKSNNSLAGLHVMLVFCMAPRPLLLI